MTNDPLTTGLLTVALVIATFLYGLLIRRRHAEEDGREQRIHTMVDNYGRSGLP
jgi:hypothetical protein